MYDPITKEIVRNALINIADEMFWTSIRTAKSSIFYDTYDFSVALTDINGEILSIGIGVPGFIGIMDFTAKYTKEYCEREGISMDPGDVFVVNNPYVSGTHLNDVGVVMPIYVNNEMIGMAVAKGHINDVGGTNPGSWGGPASTEIYQEGGLIIPPVKLYRRGGERNRDVIDIIRFNSRIPDYAIGDLEALVAALRLVINVYRNLLVSTVKKSLSKYLRIYWMMVKSLPWQVLRSFLKANFMLRITLMIVVLMRSRLR